MYCLLAAYVSKHGSLGVLRDKSVPWALGWSVEGCVVSGGDGGVGGGSVLRYIWAFTRRTDRNSNWNRLVHRISTAAPRRHRSHYVELALMDVWHTHG